MCSNAVNVHYRIPNTMHFPARFPRALLNPSPLSQPTQAGRGLFLLVKGTVSSNIETPFWDHLKDKDHEGGGGARVVSKVVRGSSDLTF
jgi:hypothetical protein